MMWLRMGMDPRYFVIFFIFENLGAMCREPETI